MKLITEITQDLQVLAEAKDDGKKSYFIEGVFLQSNLKNRNGRWYPKHILEKEVDRYTKSHIDQNRAFGELGHPDGPSINMDRVSHIIKELRVEGNDFVGKAKIMDTPMGKIVQNFLDEGARIGVSSRGMGTLAENKDGIMEVQDDFFLATAGDIVADPSAPNAFVNGIMEGVEWVVQNGRYEKFVEQARREIDESVRRRELTAEKKMSILEAFIRSL